MDTIERCGRCANGWTLGVEVKRHLGTGSPPEIMRWTSYASVNDDHDRAWACDTENGEYAYEAVRRCECNPYQPQDEPLKDRVERVKREANDVFNAVSPDIPRPHWVEKD